jgi:hypothetical protein
MTIRCNPSGALSSLLLSVGLAALTASCSPPSPHREELGTASLALSPGELLISEIYYNAPGSNDDDEEWFEVHNTSAAPIDLQGWTFKDNKNEHVIAESVVVPPGGYVVLGQNADPAKNGGVTVAYGYGTAISLSNSGDELHLIAPDGKTEIDAVVFGAGSPWPASVDGASIALAPDQMTPWANDAAASWCLSLQTFGTGKGSPGAANPGCGSVGPLGLAPAPGELVINEVMFDSDAVGDSSGEWLEIFNATADKTLDLRTVRLVSDDQAGGTQAHQLSAPSPLLLAPGGYFVLATSADPSVNGGVSGAYAYGQDVKLSNASDAVWLEVPGPGAPALIDKVIYTGTAAYTGKSRSLSPAWQSAQANDDPAHWCPSETPYGAGDLGTPGKANDTCPDGAAGQGAGGAAGQAAGGAAGQSAGGTAGQGAGGAGGAGGAAQGGASQAGAGQGGQAGAGQGGQAGQAGACVAAFHKLDINQPDAPGAPKDTAEAVELQITGDFLPGVTTLADCGVATLSPFDPDADAAGVCGPKAKYENEQPIGALVVPASGFVIIGNIPQADLPLTDGAGATSAVLGNGPAYLALRDAQGAVVAAVSYADNDAPDVHAQCDPGPATQIPADANASDAASSNQVLARCPDGWKLLLEGEITWKAPNACAGAAGAGGSAGSQGGTAGAAGSAGAGAAGAGAAGAGAAGAGAGASGGNQPGGSGSGAGASSGNQPGAAGTSAGASVGNQSGAGAPGAAGGPATGAGGAPGGVESTPVNAPSSCSLGAPGGATVVGQWGWLLVALGLASRRRPAVSCGAGSRRCGRRPCRT